MADGAIAVMRARIATAAQRIDGHRSDRARRATECAAENARFSKEDEEASESTTDGRTDALKRAQKAAVRYPLAVSFTRRERRTNTDEVANFVPFSSCQQHKYNRIDFFHPLWLKLFAPFFEFRSRFEFSRPKIIR